MKYSIIINELTLGELMDMSAKLAGVNNAVISQNFETARSEPLLSQAEIKSLHSQDQEEDVTGQVDAEGLPWDERIHSSNKKKTAKGVWVARRGVDDITRISVVNELRGAPSQPVPFVPNQQFAHLGNPIPPALGDIPVHMAEAPVVPVTQPAPVVTAPVQHTITDVFGKIQPMFAANMAEAQTYINSLTQRLSIQFQVQVQSINDIAGRPDMIAFAMQLMANDGK